MVTFYPRFEAVSHKVYEVIILLDLSNSMSTDDVTAAKQAALYLLTQLPRSCLFNVVVFGSSK